MTRAQALDIWLNSPKVTNVILAVIVFNAVILGLETSKTAMDMAGELIILADRLCLGFFILELSAKIYAQRLRFFRSGWNMFDFAIIAIAVLPFAQGLSVLRALRILRALRVVSISPALRRVVEGLVRAMPGMGSVFLLMAIIFYIAAVMATKLFGSSFPEWFGTLAASLYSLFQIMTLESWSMGIVRPVMAVYPYAWMFFVPFLLVTTFAVMNLLIGLIVNSMQEAHSESKTQEDEAHRLEITQRLGAIEDKLSALLGAKAGQ
jgi:voltage-gated sodium channel